MPPPNPSTIILCPGSTTATLFLTPNLVPQAENNSLSLSLLPASRTKVGKGGRAQEWCREQGQVRKTRALRGIDKEVGEAARAREVGKA